MCAGLYGHPVHLKRVVAINKTCLKLVLQITFNNSFNCKRTVVFLTAPQLNYIQPDVKVACQKID